MHNKHPKLFWSIIKTPHKSPMKHQILLLACKISARENGKLTGNTVPTLLQGGSQI